MGLCPECLIRSGFPTEVAAETDSATQPAFVPPTVAEMAELFLELEILELLGKGGMGAVYKARQKRLDRFVALKILPPATGSDPAFAARFTREAQALAKLNHPGIVTLYEFGETRGQFYFLMEYVDGLNLRQLLAGGRISPREALAIVPQICDALQFAHDQGIVHRDIKPENILLDRRGRVKVADFGLAKIVGPNDGRDAGLQPGSTPIEDPNEPSRDLALPELTDAGRVMGTPHYMSPEQICAPGEVDHRADIYALGVVFYQMLTGELPGKRLEPPSKKVRIDVRLDEVVLRALEQKPELRYQQVSEVKTMVEAIVATPPGSSRRPPRRSDAAASEEAQTKRSGITTTGRTSWFVSPLASPEVREISAHLTPQERSETMLYGLLWGLWVVLATFGNLWLLKSLPAPGNWIVAAIIATIFLASLPPWFRMQRRFLYSTAWARENGYAAGDIRLFSFTRRNLWRVLLFASVASLLILGQQKLFMRFSGMAELPQNLRETAVQERNQRARLEVQQHPNGVSAYHLTAHTLAGPPFVARLPDGGSIELLAVRMPPSTNEPWWQPNGAPSAFDRSIKSERGEPGDGVSALVRMKYPTPRSQWPLPAGGTNPAGVDLGNGPGFAVQFGRRLLTTEPDNDPNTMLGWVDFEAPFAGAKETTLAFKVAVADWQLVAAQKPGWFEYLFASAAPKEWKFSETPEGDLKVTITHLVENAEAEYRLVAVDMSGTEYLPNLTQRTKRADEISTTLEATFAPSQGSRDHWQLPLSRVREVRLETRPYERLEFRKVSLQPGHRTTVEVKDF